MMREILLLFVTAITALIFPMLFIKKPEPVKKFPPKKPEIKKEVKVKKEEIINFIFYIENPDIKEIVPVNCNKVVPIVYSHVMSLERLPVKKRKKKFIDVLLPEILIANEKVLKERKFLLRVLREQKMSEEEKTELERLKKKYRTDDLKELLEKVNSVPVSLILAQGAIESGWGTSRFFIEGNNVFGIYVFRPTNKKLKARNNDVYLKTYDDILQSVEDYIYNLNVGWAYEEFRKAREKGANLGSLIRALIYYSTERNNYVRLLENVIEKNHLTLYDSCSLYIPSKR
jgi:Bax protein